MLSARKLGANDYYLIEAALNDLTAKLRKRGGKHMYRYLDVPTAMSALYDFENAYIVGGNFLVVYDIGTPWYSKAPVLCELLVLRLAVGEGFQIVPEFLESRAREAGAVMVMAGTALAPSDRALASLYECAGFQRAATTLTKET